MLAVARRIWLDKTKKMCIDHVQYNEQLCLDPAFWYDKLCQDHDINRLHRQMIGGANRYMKGDVTFMETYIKFGQLIRDFHAGSGLFKQKTYPPIESIIAMHETYFSLPAGYDEIKILKLSKEYGHPAKELNLMEGSIGPSRAIKVQPGPPDWVSGQGGMTYTCEDVTISVRTRLPTLEGCLNDDM